MCISIFGRVVQRSAIVCVADSIRDDPDVYANRRWRAHTLRVILREMHGTQKHRLFGKLWQKVNVNVILTVRDAMDHLWIFAKYR